MAVIGGGVVGCAILRELSRYRLRLVLLEKEAEVGFGTSKSNSGIIHAGHHGAAGTLKGRLEWEGNQMWDQLAAELGFGFRRCGELTVALRPEDLPVLQQLKEQGEARGVPGLAFWDKETIRREEPNLHPAIEVALYAPTSGVVNPYEACFTLAQNAAMNGAELLLEHEVVSITKVEDRDVDGNGDTGNGPLFVIRARRQGGEGEAERVRVREVVARYVVNAAGTAVAQVAAMAGAALPPIIWRKGEEYLLDKRLVGIVKRTIFPCPTPTSKGILVIPTCDGTIMVGPTAHETRHSDDRATTFDGFSEVFAFVQKLVPAISPRDCIAQFAGLRTVAEGEDFIIETAPIGRFVQVAGIQSPGLTAAPAIARMVASLLEDEGLRLTEKDDFRPTLPPPVRFGQLSPEEQAALAAAHPEYRCIVCRCENVTEGEIVAAIKAGARTLDGLKFRTRAGMGRCQGGFCTTRCMELLSRELGIPMTAITKRGGGSWIVTGRPVPVGDQGAEGEMSSANHMRM